MKMPDWTELLVVALGVIVAVLWPVLREMVRRAFPSSGTKAKAAPFPPWLKKGALLVLFGLVTGLVALAILRQARPEGVLLWHEALLAGFAWESTLEKVIGVSTL